ncbi:hypothetical protein ABFS83_06G130300 [Erythranthe nasuta]
MAIHLYIQHHFLISTINKSSKTLLPFLPLTHFIILSEKFFRFRLSFHTKMAIRQMLRRSLSNERKSAEVPKGHLAVYVGQSEKKRFVIPLSYLNHPLFQDLLSQAEEEFGFHHPMGGITIPCSEDLFVDLTSRLSRT